MTSQRGEAERNSPTSLPSSHLILILPIGQPQAAARGISSLLEVPSWGTDQGREGTESFAYQVGGPGGAGAKQRIASYTGSLATPQLLHNPHILDPAGGQGLGARAPAPSLRSPRFQPRLCLDTE